MEARAVSEDEGRSQRLVPLAGNERDLFGDELKDPTSKNPDRRERCLPIVLASAKSPYSDTMAAIAGKTVAEAVKKDEAAN